MILLMGWWTQNQLTKTKECTVEVEPVGNLTKDCGGVGQAIIIIQ
jgi:hypothetical protein